MTLCNSSLVRRLPGFAAVVTIVAVSLPSHWNCASAAESDVASPASLVHPYRSDALPALKASCVECHNNKKHKGDVNFESPADILSAVKQRKLWRKAAEQVEQGDMPPEDAKPMDPAKRAALLAWMKQAAVAADCGNLAERDPGPPPLRRLTRAEYDNTIHDLLGLNFKSGEAVGMPDDTPAEGFANLANGQVLPPALMDKYFAAADQMLDQLLIPPAATGNQYKDKQRKAEFDKLRAALMTPQHGGSVDKRDAAKQIVARIARRAFRRLVPAEEIDRYLKVFDLADARGESFDVGVRYVLKAVLVSPNFLFRIERDRAASASKAPTAYAVTDVELASRLSYFLWSTMPDEELLSMAEKGELSKPATLEAQVRRMLTDPKAHALTENFAVAWLQLNKLATARPSTEFFPAFNAKLRAAFYDETVTFFDKLREDDRPVLDLLDADYTYANADLAKFYKLPEVKGDKPQRVALKPSDHRGGLLGMGSILALTSHTSRTSPTLRGKWVLEVIFNDPPPPPPANAGMFKDEGKQKKDATTFREKLAQHATDPTCANCHRRIDPLGFALEDYDAIGTWRTEQGGKPVDDAAQLPNGEKFTGADGLKKIVWARRDQFLRGVAEQMLKYALGRELGDEDECAVREVTARMAKGEQRFSALVLGVAESYPFRYRRNADATGEGK